MSQEDFIPNERLRRARSLKGWSQAELAEQVGTSFELVSRWERGVTIPSHYYRERLSFVLDKTAGELGLTHNSNGTNALPPSSLVFLASSYVDAEKEVVSYLKSSLQDRGFTLWDSRQIGRQGGENSRTALREAIQAAEIILVIISPQAHSSRHVRETLELAGRYLRPVYGVWIEGENWQECLPKGNEELAALIDARGKDAATLIEEVATALKHMEPVSASMDISTSARSDAQILASARDPLLTVLPLPLPPTLPGHRKRLSRTSVGMLVGLTFLVIIGGFLGSLSLLAHFGVLGAHSGPPAVIPVRGGIWTDDLFQDADSFLSIRGYTSASVLVDQALYLPLFYGDAQGVVHPGAASEIPGLQNGGISADVKTWTFHLRPHLVWSDRQPYDARDVDFTWRLWLNPKFGAASTYGLSLISSVDVSADYLSITFHLTRAFAPFLSYWVDGYFAPLPAHHFSRMSPGAIPKSPDNLNPQVVSGPFMMAESVPGDHYTLVRNPRYYLASEGLPYLDKVIFRIVSLDGLFKDLQAGSIDSSQYLYGQNFEQYLRLSNYPLVTSPTTSYFEALYFNFHNQVLASRPEVREAITKAIDRQALIAAAPPGLDTPLCTDHGSAYHPGSDPTGTICPVFDPATANKLLDDNGWVKGPDGVRSKGGQRLEFEYSASVSYPPPGRLNGQVIVQRNLQAIGIKLDIQNYDSTTFFNSLLPGGRPHLQLGPSPADMTSPSLAMLLGMIPTIPHCSPATRFRLRAVEPTLAFIATGLWMLFTSKNRRQRIQACGRVSSGRSIRST